ncbi:MAG: hypothetical protein FIA98_06890 [Anaerolineae bacterium]|nr:hypothetical protein [Anaerolineae bacterium]
MRETLNNQTNLDESLSSDLNHMIKKFVNVPGVRSSDKAPALVKVVPTSKAFEKNPELVAVLLAGWAETHSDLREKVYSLLQARHWKTLSESEESLALSALTEAVKEWPVFPIKMNRAKLPGFYTHWPKDEDFEVLYKNFSDLYPDIEVSIDKVSLMVVWLSMRLPLQVDEIITKPGDAPISENP